MKRFSNLDYLINAQKSSVGSADSADTPAVEEAAVALGGLILRELHRSGGSGSAFQLVDATEIPLETLFKVLETLSSRFRWVEIDRSDPRGNYLVKLTSEGKDYLRRAASMK